jgi:hypothetical protein
MPTSKARFVVLGATNGPAFTSNACLRALATWARVRHLPTAAYAVIHYPTRAELRQYGGAGSLATVLRRVGAAEATHALRTLRAAGVATPIVWVDVETVGGHPWSRTPASNRLVLDGTLTAYRRAHVPTGLYSYRSAWQHVMGGRRMPRVPTWVPSGGVQYRDGLAKCSAPSFSGGPVVMAQWSVDGRDHNITCPGVRSAGLFRRA